MLPAVIKVPGSRRDYVQARHIREFAHGRLDEAAGIARKTNIDLSRARSDVERRSDGDGLRVRSIEEIGLDRIHIALVVSDVRWDVAIECETDDHRISRRCATGKLDVITKRV